MRKHRKGARRLLGGLLAVVLVGAVVLLAQRGVFSSLWDEIASWEGAAGSSTVGTPAAPGETALVYFLDVGQGDSQLLRIPREGDYFTVLLDTGEYAYAQGLESTLEELGVNRIDLLIASHPHTDHMGGMARIVRQFPVEAIYMPLLPEDQTPTSTGYRVLLEAMEEKGLEGQALSRGQSLLEGQGLSGSARLEVLSPPAGERYSETNLYSAVLRFSYGKHRFLFTGDAEAENEVFLLEQGDALKADVLKVAHHGSFSSSTWDFVDAVDPGWAVFSCGKDNQYGYPKAEIVGRFESIGTEIFRTDLDQTVLAQVTGDSITWITGLAGVPNENAEE